MGGVAGPPKLKLTPPKPYQVVVGQPPATWRPGVITLVKPSRIPLGAVTLAKNCMQTQDGVWSTRWGSQNYGASFTGPVTGFAEITKEVAGVVEQYYVIMDNGILKMAKDGGAWTTLVPGGTFTWDTSQRTCFVQWENKLLIANGVDPFSYYDLSTDTFVQFTALSTPGSITPTLLNLSAGTYPLYYVVTALSSVGETVGSPVLTVNVDQPRDSWFNQNTGVIGASSPGVELSWTTISNAVGYNIYLSDGISGVAYYLASVGQPASGSTAKFTDYGINAVNDFIEVPPVDTTTAPAFNWLAISNNRLWACGDPNNLNRIYWAGVGQYSEAFNAYLGGGWVDILPGSTQLPTTIHEFRDGKGDPLTTILLAEPSGYGTTYHCDLQSDQIGNTTIIVPVLLKAVGTFGTLSPYGVVETNQNIYFHSGTGGFYSNGSVPTLFNILATNEISIMVRPDIKQLYLKGLNGLCGIEYDRKIFWSVPYANPTNNRIMIYDLEKLNWNPYAFDFGVSQFIRYTDNSQVTHLLAIPVDGNHILELNEKYTNDNGVAFQSVLQTGLHHVSPDHIQFAHVTYFYFDFGDPQNTIELAISGIAYNQPLEELVAVDIETGSTLSTVGLSSFPLSSTPLSFGSLAPVVITEQTVKERVRIFQLLNNWQVTITSSNSNSQWTLNQLTAVGQYVPVADPSSWITN